MSEANDAVTSPVERLVMCREDGMKGAVKHLENYWESYERQHGYEKYSTEIFIDDALYGLGISIDPEKYKFADGYKKFKEDLKSWLDT